jgi:hypothetical protein
VGRNHEGGPCAALGSEAPKRTLGCVGEDSGRDVDGEADLWTTLWKVPGETGPRDARCVFRHACVSSAQPPPLGEEEAILVSGRGSAGNAQQNTTPSGEGQRARQADRSVLECILQHNGGWQVRT